MANEFDFGFDFQYPEVDWSFGLDPSIYNTPMDFSFGMPDFNFGMPSWDFSQMDFGNFAMPAWDPLALPPLPDMSQFMAGGESVLPGFMTGAGPETFEAMPPMTLPDLQYGGTGAPTAPMMESYSPGADPILNLMATQPPSLGFGEELGLGGLGYGELTQPGAIASSPYAPPPILGGPIGTPVSNTPYQFPTGTTVPTFGQMPGLGREGFPPGAAVPTAGAGASMSEQERYFADLRAKMAQGKSPWEIAAGLGGAFGPMAMQGIGLGLQAANRPRRNPLEDELLRARIASSGVQDALARERLAFEQENAARAAEMQMEMQGAQAEAAREMQAAQARSAKELQDALIASRRPGGTPNIQALLASNPQLSALYNALTQSGTALAKGETSPEFQALIDQIAQVDIGALQRQAQEQIAQANEQANRLGTNPAGIIAKVQEQLLQETAKARANARTTLMSMMQPGQNILNVAGGLFGQLAQVPTFT